MQGRTDSSAVRITMSEIPDVELKEGNPDSWQEFTCQLVQLRKFELSKALTK